METEILDIFSAFFLVCSLANAMVLVLVLALVPEPISIHFCFVLFCFVPLLSRFRFVLLETIHQKHHRQHQEVEIMCIVVTSSTLLSWHHHLESIWNLFLSPF